MLISRSDLRLRLGGQGQQRGGVDPQDKDEVGVGPNPLRVRYGQPPLRHRRGHIDIHRTGIRSILL